MLIRREQRDHKPEVVDVVHLVVRVHLDRE